MNIVASRRFRDFRALRRICKSKIVIRQRASRGQFLFAYLGLFDQRHGRPHRAVVGDEWLENSGLIRITKG